MVPMEKNTDKYTHSTRAAPSSAQSPGTSNKGKLSYSWVTKIHLLENLMSHYMNKGNIHEYHTQLTLQFSRRTEPDEETSWQNFESMRTHLSIMLLLLIFNYNNPSIL